MKSAVCSLFLAALVASGLHANAASNQDSATHRTHSLILESPSQLPELAQTTGEALYLHNTGGGQTLLYIEGSAGKSLAILDVTNPAKIRPVARIPLASSGAFDFVENADDASTVVIRYRDGSSSYALLNLRKASSPQLAPLPANYTSAENIGPADLLLTTTASLPTLPHTSDYAIVDTTAPSPVVATVPGVKQSVANSATGTIFLLANNGITVVRHPETEAEYAINDMITSHN